MFHTTLKLQSSINIAWYQMVGKNLIFAQSFLTRTKNQEFEVSIGAKTCIFITLHFHEKLIENIHLNLK